MSAGSFASRVGVECGFRQDFPTAISAPAGFVVIGQDLALTMRWFVHVLARLAVTATCTSSAAALDAQIEHREYSSFTASLWEHLMLHSSKSVNGAARRYIVPGNELHFDARNRRGIAHEQLTQAPRSQGPGANSLPPVMPAMTLADATWMSMVAFFVEGFALFGASYCASLHALAAPVDESGPTESRDEQEERVSWRERPRLIALVSSSTTPELARVEDDTNRAGPGSEMPSGVACLSGFYGSPSSTYRSNRRNWLTKPWSVIAGRWSRWRREREIRKAVAALEEFNDRELRDVGILCRSGIDQVVRYGRDC